MRTPNPTAARAVPAACATVSLLASLLYVGGGCAGGGGAESKEKAALQSYVQGVLAYQSGDTDKAVLKLEDAVSKKSNLVMARSMLGDLYRSRSNYDAAREQYEAATKLDPYDYVHHYHLGFALQVLRRFEDAAVSYLKALDLKPDDAPTNMYLGTVYMVLVVNDSDSMSPDDKAKLRERAVRYAQRAADIDPTSAAAWANLAVVLDDAKLYPRAEGAYRKALDLDANQPLLQLYLGENLMRQGKFPESRSVLSELVKTQDNKVHRLRLGDAYAYDNKFDDALGQYQAALKHDANYYVALNRIADVYMAEYDQSKTLDESKRKAAVDAWQQSLSINRSQPEIAEKFTKWSKSPAF